MGKKDSCERELDRACAYCEEAAPLYDCDHMLCSRKGVVDAGYVCRHFSYDPLKRIPAPRRRVDEEFEFPVLPD